MTAEATGNEFLPVSKADAAYERLRNEIRRGAFEPGERVTLKRLSEMLGMSLTPVRESLKRLETEGFVIHQPHRGTFIAEVSADRLDQIYRLRGVLEPMAIQLAAERVAREGLSEELDQIKELLLACDAASSPLEVVRRNDDLHRAIYGLSDDPLLIEFIDKLWAGVPYQSLSLYESSERIQQSRREHHFIYEALAAGDEDSAAKQLRTHIEHGRTATIRAL